MLAFLNSVYDRVVDTFNNLYWTVRWFVYSAFNHVNTYITYLKDSLLDYRNTKQLPLTHYVNVAMWKVEDIIVANFNKSRYVSVDSFYDIGEFRGSLLGRLRDFRDRLYNRLAFWYTQGRNNIDMVVTLSGDTLSYLVNNVPGIVWSYATFEKPTISLFALRKTVLDKLTEPFHATRILDIADTAYASIVEIKNWGIGLLNQIRPQKDKLLSLVDSFSFERLRGLITTDYEGIHGLLDISQKLGHFTSQTTYERLNYLTGDSFGKIMGLNENPTNTILAYLRGKFFDWFLGELLDWLEEEF